MQGMYGGCYRNKAGEAGGGRGCCTRVDMYMCTTVNCGYMCTVNATCPSDWVLVTNVYMYIGLCLTAGATDPPLQRGLNWMFVCSLNWMFVCNL